MSRYTATATHKGRWWVIEVHGVGVTQARTVAETQEMVDDLVRLLTDDRAPSVDVTFQVGDVNATTLTDTVRGKTAAAEAARDEAARANREAARTLSAAGVSGNDIAGLLHVSPQRVSQLLAPASARTPTRKPAKSRKGQVASVARSRTRSPAVTRNPRGRASA